MANVSSIFDFAAQTKAQFLATAASDGTRAAIFQTLKIDKTGQAVAASGIAQRAGQLWANGVDDFMLASYDILRMLSLGSASGGLKLDDLAAPDDNTDLNASSTKHGLLPKLSNVATEFLTGIGTWATVGPEVVCDLDWTAEANYTVSANGNVSVDGNNWTSANYASASLFSLTLGTGLRITSNSGSSLTWTTAAVTAPSLRINVETLAPEAADPSRDLWVWSYFSAYSCPVSANTILAGLYSAATGNYTVSQQGGGFNHNGSAVYPYQHKNSTVTPNTAVATTFDVIVHRMCANGSLVTYGGNMTGGGTVWPTRAALVHVATDNQPEAAAIVTLAKCRRPNMQLIYAPLTRSASGAPSFTLARTKIELD